MKQIQARARSVEELLSNQTFQIDYYQREYRWEITQVEELVDDLVSAFQEDYKSAHSTEEVKGYGNYFLGPIIVSQRESETFIVDGQQRLTTLTLLLIYLEQERAKLGRGPNLADLIYNDDFGTETFNLKVPEREVALRSLLKGEIPDITGMSESVINIVARYQDIADRFPYEGNETSVKDGSRELTQDSLVHFLYWITKKVFLVEIAAASDDDAYTIFETMNDRGLSLTPTDMLKGYLLSNIQDEKIRLKANEVWRDVIGKLHEDDREVSADFFKSWLRSQYGRTIRTGSVGKIQDFDFDRIGSEFHRWVRDESTGENSYLSLHHWQDFAHFTDTKMPFFARVYQIIGDASEKTEAGLEPIRYNATRSFTLQPMLLMAPVRLGDSHDLVLKKIRLVSMYLDIVLARREWNQRVITQRAMRVAMFNQMKQFRDCIELQQLAQTLYQMLQASEEDFDTNHGLGLNKTNGTMIKRTLARITEFVANGSGQAVDYDTLMSPIVKNRFDIEHIWAKKITRQHKEEFPQESDFQDYRNRIGGLLLLPSPFNSSYGDKPYDIKLEQYFGQNPLAKSLHPNAYKYHPGFAQFIDRTKLPFQPHEEFRKADLDARQELYREIAKQIWNPQRLLDEVTA